MPKKNEKKNKKKKLASIRMNALLHITLKEEVKRVRKKQKKTFVQINMDLRAELKLINTIFLSFKQQ
jgi:hypothetical protein